MSQSSSVRQARQVIADRLREILRDSGLTARALAHRAGWDESKCSRLVHGRTPPSDDDIRGAATDIDEAVTARIARRRYLADGSRRCAMLIEEPVLTARFATDEVMIEQLEYVLTGMLQPNLSLGVIPASASRTYWHAETFSLYDESRVFIELVSAAVTVTQPREISLYVKLFEALSQAAVYGDEARALISRALISFR